MFAGYYLLTEKTYGLSTTRQRQFTTNSVSTGYKIENTNNSGQSVTYVYFTYLPIPSLEKIVIKKFSKVKCVLISEEINSYVIIFEF